MSDSLEPDDLVLLGTYPRNVDAHLARTFLENQGIEVHLIDEHFNNLYSDALGGVKLVVPQADLERAKELLASVQKGELVTEDGDVRGEACPRCQSTKTLLNTAPPANGWSRIIQVLPLPFGSKSQWTCTQCQHQWRSKAPR